MVNKLVRRRPPPRPGLFQRLRRDFLTGLVVVLPMFLTVYIVWATIGFIDNRVLPLIPNSYNPENIFGRNIFGLGVLVFLAFTTIVGAMAKGLIGRQILGLGERMVERMPVVRSVYNGLKQIVETIFSQTSTSFQKACLIEYPRNGIWAVAFVSTDAKGEVLTAAGEEELVSVFLPTTPNPTSGFLLFIPRRDIKPLEMTIEEAAKLIISAGLVSPPEPGSVPVTARKRRSGSAVS